MYFVDGGDDDEIGWSVEIIWLDPLPHFQLEYHKCFDQMALTTFFFLPPSSSSCCNMQEVSGRSGIQETSKERMIKNWI